MMRFIAFVACVLLVQCTVTNGGGGYSLSFGWDQPVAALRKGFIDFSDPGMEAVDKEATFTMWARYSDFSLFLLRPLFHWKRRGDPNFFQPFIQTYGYAFGGSVYPNLGLLETYDPLEWNFYAAVLKDDNLKLYINGVRVANVPLSGGSSLRADKTSFQIGAHTYTGIDTPAYADSQKAFSGEVDEVSLFSRALTEEQIVARMQAPVDVEAPMDPTIVLHYSFEVVCENATTSDLRDEACDVSGTKTAKNYGIAGPEYDLLLGSLNDDFGFGKSWYESTNVETCTGSLPFGQPIPAASRIPFHSSLMDQRHPVLVQTYLAGGSFSVDFSFDCLGKSFRLASSLPPEFELQRENGTALVENDTFTVGSERLSIVSLNASSTLAFRVSLVEESLSKTLSLDFWKYESPRLTSSAKESKSVHSIFLEDQSLELRTKVLGATYQDDLQVVVLEPPRVGKIYQSNITGLEVLGNDVANLTIGKLISQTNETISHPSGAVWYLPVQDTSGRKYDSFKVLFRSKTFPELESEALTFHISVETQNDLPTVQSARTRVEEDDEEGVVIPLIAGDSEGAYGIIIKSLPKHGSLYLVDENDKSIGEITSPYEVYDVGTVVSLYASQVLNVSSFWGNPPETAYHPINVLGRPTCGRVISNSECTDERSDQVPGDYVFVRTSDGIRRLAKVLEVDSRKGLSLQVVPMQREVNGSFLPCWMEGETYPTDCNPTSIHATNGPVRLDNVESSAIESLGVGSVWSPLNKGFIGDSRIIGDEKTGAFGVQYKFDFNQYQGYTEDEPRWTEFIEVSFEEALFFIAIEIGTSRGAGAVVSLKARDPLGEWQVMYSGRPDLNIEESFSSRGIYHRFSPTLCRPFFKATELRIELDTSTETGIPDWNYIDYIKVYGAREAQRGMLRYPNNKVRYVPSPDHFGEDKFTFASVDCGGDVLRESEQDGTVMIHVSPKPDTPRGFFMVAEKKTEDENMYRRVESEDEATFHVDLLKMDFELHVNDVDNEIVNVRLIKTPTLCTLSYHNMTESLSSGAILNVDWRESNLFGVVAFSLHDVQCTKLREEVFELRFDLTDEPDMLISEPSSTTVSLNIKVDCRRLGRKYKFETYAPLAVRLSKVYGILGIFISALFAAVQIIWRRLQVIRFTSPLMNLSLLLGTTLIYSYLLLIRESIGSSDSCASLEVSGRDTVPNLSCSNENMCCTQGADMHCRIPLCLLSMGFILVFGSLLSKTLRVYKVFSSDKIQRKRISDCALLRRVVILVLILVFYLSVWFAFDPPVIEIRLGQEALNPDTQEIMVPLIGSCRSGNGSFFEAGLVTAFGILLACGAYIAWLVRGVHIPEANESRQIALSVYNIVLFGVINLVLRALKQDSTTLLYISSTSIFACTSMSQVFLFAPRLVDISTGKTKISISPVSDTTDILDNKITSFASSMK